MIARWRVRLEQFFAPGYGGCNRCGRPWRFAKPHQTAYAWVDGLMTSACFPLCEGCWTELKYPALRMLFYARLVSDWGKYSSGTIEERLNEAIMDAVLKGG